MSQQSQTVDVSAVSRALRRAPTLDHDAVAEGTVEPLSDGVNEVFGVRTDGAELVVKFGTFSTAASLRAGVAAARLLGASTDLPVPTVHAAEYDTDGLPPFVVQERRPGTPLVGGFEDPDATAPDAVGVLGAVIDATRGLPADATAGYGFIEGLADGVEAEDGTRIDPRAVAPYDDCGAWLVDYGAGFLDEVADHEALTAVAPRAASYLRANWSRLPTAPDSAVVLTDLSPGNLLAPGGVTPETAGGLTGVVDLERAKLGPAALTAVNTEYLLTWDLADPDPVREALYEPLPFGPSVPNRDCYLLVAAARAAWALPTWYDPGSERFDDRARALAATMRAVVD